MRLAADAAIATNCRVLQQLHRGHHVRIHPGTRTAAAVTQAIRSHAHLHGSGLARELASEIAAQLWTDHEEIAAP